MDSQTAPRFPTSVGILFGISLCAHLAAVVQSIFGENLAGAALFLIGQAVLAFGLLRLINGAWIFQDIRFCFVLFFFLYGGTLPLWLAWAGAHIPGVAGAAFLYATGLLGFNVVQWWYKRPSHDIPARVFAQTQPTFANALLVALAVALLVAYAFSRGVRISLTMDRGYAQWLGTQLWVVSMFALNGMAMFMFAGWSQVSWRARVIFIVSIAAFVLFHLALGNRRDFLPMFIFLAAVIAMRRQSVIRPGTVLVGVGAFAGFTLIGVLRQVLRNPLLLTINPGQLFISTSEFAMPIQTLIHYATVDRPLRWGWTYLSAPSLFIPRVIWADKPESLSLQFLRDAYGSTAYMGFAYTPVTEAFLNFGWVGPFVVFAIVSILLVKLVRRADAHPGLYLICFAYVVDFNRGAFGETAYSLIFVAAGYGAMWLVSRARWLPDSSRTAKPVRSSRNGSAQHAALTT